MRRDGYFTRRNFLTHSTATLAACGAGGLGWLSRSALADQTQLAARIDQAPEKHPLLPAIRMAQEALASLDEIKDYTCLFTKRELVGRKIIDSTMDMKLREEPFSVYLKFRQPSAGREVLYQKGKNDGKLQAHETGFASLAGTLSLDPEGSTAMGDNRYPITMIGMRHLVTKLLEQWLDEIELTGMAINVYPNAKIGTLACKAVESSYRKPGTGIRYQMSRMYVDASTGHPIRVQQYEFPGRRETDAKLVEDYQYSEIKPNVGLTDDDFSTANKSYSF